MPAGGWGCTEYAAIVPGPILMPEDIGGPGVVVGGSAGTGAAAGGAVVDDGTGGGGDGEGEAAGPTPVGTEVVVGADVAPVPQAARPIAASGTSRRAGFQRVPAGAPLIRDSGSWPPSHGWSTRW